MLAYALPCMYSMFALHLGRGVAVDGFSSLWPSQRHHLQRSSLAYHLSQLHQGFRWRALVRPSLCYKGKWKLKVCVASEQRGSIKAEQQRNNHALHELLNIVNHRGMVWKVVYQYTWHPRKKHRTLGNRLATERFPDILRVNVACEKKTWACDFLRAPDSLKSQKNRIHCPQKTPVVFPQWISRIRGLHFKVGLWACTQYCMWCNDLMCWHSIRPTFESSINPGEKPCFVKDPSCFGNGRRRFRVDTASFLVLEKEWTRNISDSVRVRVFFFNQFVQFKLPKPGPSVGGKQLWDPAKLANAMSLARRIYRITN